MKPEVQGAEMQATIIRATRMDQTFSKGYKQRRFTPNIVTLVAAIIQLGSFISVPLGARAATVVPSVQQPTRNDSTAASTASQPSAQQIRLVMNASALRTVLLTLSQESKQPVYFTDKDPRFDQRISVNITAPNVMAAFTAVLKGTGLVATLGPDGRTIVIAGVKGAKVNTNKDEGIIVGAVVDSATKKPLAGVTVLIRGTKLGATTREDGQFRFTNVPIGSRAVVVRLLGYHTRTVTVTVTASDTARVVVVLQQSSTSLTEVVTTAMGQQRRIDISNDVVTINADKLIESAPIRNVTDLLVAAQVPGMIVTKSSGDPNAPTRIRFGGPGSISQSNDPVVIVDGIWIKSSFSTPDVQRGLATLNGVPSTYVLGGGSQYVPSRLDEIDPSMIETIEIVRGPAATSLYGPDAANGVIRITTKRGRAGPTRWDITAFRNIGSPVGNKPPTYQGYGHTTRSSETTLCGTLELSYGACIQDSLVIYDPDSPLLNNEGGTYTNSLSLSVSGGSNALTYNVTGSMQDGIGPRRFPGALRVGLRQMDLPMISKFQLPSQNRTRALSARIGMTPRPGLEVSLDFSGSQRNSQENTVDIVGLGAPDDTITTLRQPVTFTPSQNNTTVTHGTMNVSTTWNARAWMNATATLGVDRTYQDEANTSTDKNCTAGAGCIVFGSGQAGATGRSSVYSMRIQSNFFPQLGWAGRFIAIRPGIAFDVRRDVNAGSGLFLYSPVGGAQRTTLSAPWSNSTALAGLSVNAYVTLFDRISFDPGFRRDFASSRSFQNAQKSYPRFGTSWLISDESFFPKTQWITLLRLRGAFGYAAVQPDLAAVQGGYLGGSTMVNGQSYPVVRFVRLGNSGLAPERSVELETGFDAELLGDRISLTFTHSNKRNINTLINRVVAPSSGVPNDRQENVARILNQQTTLELMTRPVDLPNLTLRLGANIAVLNNKVQTLGQGVSPFGPGEQRYVGGYPVGGLWALPLLGVHDINGDGYLGLNEYDVGDTLVYIGSNVPRYTVGYNIEVGFLQRFSFSARMDYQGKGMQNRTIDPNSLRGRWDADASIAEQMLVFGSWAASTAADYQSISMLRWQSASLTVDLPNSWLRVMRARRAQLSLQGSNLGLWTNYHGRDPGVNSTPIGERTTDNGLALGIPRAYVVQLRLGY